MHTAVPIAISLRPACVVVALFVSVPVLVDVVVVVEVMHTDAVRLS